MELVPTSKTPHPQAQAHKEPGRITLPETINARPRRIAAKM